MNIDSENTSTLIDSYQDKKFDSIIRKNEKDLVRPYRRYQLSILTLLILMIFFLFVLNSLNKKLNSVIKENEDVENRLNQEKEIFNDLTEINNKVEVNYASLYKLDKSPNIEIIREIEELYMISGFIGNPENIGYSICFKSSIHGDNGSTFREQCQGIAPLLVLIETADGYRFGGYTSVPFTNDEYGYKYDEQAFLFSFDTKKKYKIIKTEKAISNLKGQFPVFGNNDIYIHNNFLSAANSIIEYPNAYEDDPNAPGDFMLNGGVKKFKIKELEILSVEITH